MFTNLYRTASHLCVNQLSVVATNAYGEDIVEYESHRETELVSM